MKKYEIKKIMHVRRLGTSLYGNPYFELIFDDFTSARTQINASINYEVENKDLWETDVAIFTTKAGRVWNIMTLDKLVSLWKEEEHSQYRWIVYLHQPHGGFSIGRASSIEMVKGMLMNWSESVYVFEQASASLYPYSKEDWAEAKEYEEIGCPFDYPSKVMEFGPRGGIKVTNA